MQIVVQIMDCVVSVQVVRLFVNVCLDFQDQIAKVKGNTISTQKITNSHKFQHIVFIF